VKKDTNVNIRLSSDVRAELQRLADADGRKLSSYIDRLLQLHVRGELRKSPPPHPGFAESATTFAGSERERRLPAGEATGRRYFKRVLTWEVAPVDSAGGRLADPAAPRVRLFLTDGSRETAIYDLTTSDAERLSTDLYNFAVAMADASTTRE
jgi:hypothetical protein